jgi:predicted CoA-substrate-specific enzyme activase
VILTAGIDIGSTYTKAVVLSEEGTILSKAMEPTGFRLGDAGDRVYRQALEEAKVAPYEVRYVVATGFGRHQSEIADLKVTDLTAAARGVRMLFPNTRTILDVGGQTMKASRIGPDGKVKSFRLNDKCAAGTGAFLEKTARYLGYTTGEIGPLVETSRDPVPVSGVCAVFAESEVINHLSQGAAPADIMHGAIRSLVARSLQLLKRVGMEPEFTLIGGILRFRRMVEAVEAQLRSPVNVPQEDLVQFVAALGAAALGHQRLRKLQETAA